MIKKIKAHFTLARARKILKEYLKTAVKPVLLVSHQLNATGSPLMLLHLTKKLLQEGFSPFIISYSGGTLLKTFESLGVKVAVGEFFGKNDKVFSEFAKHFDKIIANTIVCYKVVKHCPEALWWIHEGQNIDNEFMEDLEGLEGALRKAKNIFVVSEYAANVVEKYNSNIEIIRLGVKDACVHSPKTWNSLRFAFVGNVCECKAQDISASAILGLNENYLRKSEFHFFCEKKSGRYKRLKKSLKHLKNVHFRGLFSPKNKWQEFSKMDVFVIPSRDESCSLVALEACMLKKPVIISENVGASYMVDKNGYIVKTQDADALKEILENMIDSDNLQEMCENSREMYEKHAKFEIFEKDLEKITSRLTQCKSSQVSHS